MRNVIVGAGPAAAAAALALSGRDDESVTVLDVGLTLESGSAAARDRLAGAPRTRWSSSDLAAIDGHAVPQRGSRLPQKRSYGSDFPFRNVGQRRGVRAAHGANEDVISGAYGGFSNVWGAQVMPFTRATFATDWPIDWADIEPHYRAVLHQLPLAGQHDDLAALFPLLVEPQPLPPLAPSSRAALDRYRRHADVLREHGVICGAARLAFEAQHCVSCARCLTGCPLRLIYDSGRTLDRLRASGRATYVGDTLVEGYQETADGVQVRTRSLRTGRVATVDADRLFIAAGAIGTTRLVVATRFPRTVHMTLAESQQLVIPFASYHPVPDPRGADGFTLNQFNILLRLGDDDRDLAHVHMYPYNPAFDDALPAVLRTPALRWVQTSAIRRITVGLGYLPSWRSPRVELTFQPSGAGVLPDVDVRGALENPSPRARRAVLRKLLRAAPMLDLWPILPAVDTSGPAKSYHYGGSFPHARDGRAAGGSTDPLGRLVGSRRVHLIDGSVLPTVASTTFTLTVMANAHRIASAAVDGAGHD